MANKNTSKTTTHQPGSTGLSASNTASSHSVNRDDLSPEYQKLFDANPWNQYVYNDGLWDRLGDYFGFRTNQDANRENMESASRQYESQLLSLQREEQYNSEASQAERQRQAGINPDLNGVSPSQASEFNEPQNPPVVPGANTEYANFIGSLGSLITTTVGLVGDIQGMNALRLDNDSKRLDLATKYLTSGSDYLTKALEFSDLDPKTNKFSVTLPSLKDSGLPKRMQRRFFASLDRSFRSMDFQTKLYKSISERADARKEYASKVGSSKYSEDDEDMIAVFGLLGDLAYNLQVQDSRSRLKKAEADESAEQNRLEYEDTLRSDPNDSEPVKRAMTKKLETGNEYAYQASATNQRVPESKASAESAQYSEAAASAKAHNEMMDQVRSTISKLNEMADNGSVVASIVSLLIPIFLQYSGGSALGN